MEVNTEGVLDLSIEDDVLEKLDEHGKKLDSHDKKLEEHDKKLCVHDDKLVEFQIINAGFAERFNNIDATLVRIENSSLQSSNILLNTMSQIAINTSSGKMEIAKENSKSGNEIVKTKINNNLAIVLKVLGVISAVGLGYLSARYGISVK